MTALAMAVRIQTTLDEIAALKGRTVEEIEQEERLTRRLRDVLAAQMAAVGRSGMSPEMAVALIDDRDDALLEVLLDEVGPIAEDAIADVAAAVAAAKDIREVRRELRRRRRRGDLAPGRFGRGAVVRPTNMDRALFATMTRLRTNLLGRLRDQTLAVLVDAAGMPADQVRAKLAELLDLQLAQLSRHAIGDTRNEATEQAERSLGVRRHRWVTAGDDLVRDAHAAVDGEVVEVGEPFSNGWRRPGGIGCRCRLEPVLEAA